MARPDARHCNAQSRDQFDPPTGDDQGITVNVVSPVTPPLVADTVVLPTLAAVARPFDADGVAHRRHRVVGRGPGGLRREVLRRVVRVVVPSP